MTENEIVDNLKVIALEKSRFYSSNDYAFAFGFFAGEMVSILSELNLTKKQQKLAEEFVNNVNNRKLR